MLKIEINGLNNKLISLNGSLIEITAEMGMAIQGVHCAFLQRDPKAAKLFRKGLSNLVNNPKSPIWEPPAGGPVTIDLSGIAREEEQK